LPGLSELLPGAPVGSGIPRERSQAAAVSGLESDGNSRSHPYCARGDMENRIKEYQLDLYADRTSTATMRANQLRLWFASMAYVLLCALRRIGLHDTDLAPRLAAPFVSSCSRSVRSCASAFVA
jgi:hypothetical protein